MSPIENRQYSDAYRKYVTQDALRVVNQHLPEHQPKKPFNIEPADKSEKSKKDLHKKKDREDKKRQ